MAQRNMDGVSYLDQAMTQAHPGTSRFDASAFFAGFGDGFGFSGLFARLEQVPLPELTDASCDSNHSEEYLVPELVDSFGPKAE